MTQLHLYEAIVHVREDDRVIPISHRRDGPWTKKNTSAFIQEVQTGVWGPMYETWYPFHQIAKVEFKIIWIEA